MPNAPRKHIWLEPTLGGNRARLIKRCQSAVQSGQEDRFIYLAATRPLAERVLAEIVDGNRVAACRGLSVFLFDELVKRLLADRGTARYDRTLIEDDAKYFLIEQVMSTLTAQGALRFMRDIALTPGCVQEMGDLIGELKRSDKRPEDFRQFLREFGGDYRDEDLAAIYEGYQQRLNARRLIDIDDAYGLVRDRLTRGDIPPWLARVEWLVIDSFFDFAPIQDELLKQLAGLIPDVIVNLSFDPRNPSVFAPLQSTIEGLLPLGFVPVDDPAPALKRWPLLEPVARDLFNPESEPGQTTQPIPISIFSAPHRLGEAQEIARQVKRLVVEEGYRPGDIAVVVRNAESYGPVIRRVFVEAGLPCRLDERSSLSAIPSVKAALKILDARAGWDQIDAFEALIKNDYVEPFSVLSRDALDNALVAVGRQLRTRDWLDRAQRIRQVKAHVLERGPDRSVDPEALDLDAQRRRREVAELDAAIQSVRVMREYLEAIPDKGTLGDFIVAYRRVLHAFRIRRRLEDRLPTAARAGAGLSGLARDLKGLHRVAEILNDAAQLSDAGTAAMSVGEFKSLIEHRIGRARLRLAAGDAHGVPVLEVRQCHGLHFRAVFVAGLTQGVFPQTPRWDWMYSPSDRQRLADFGLHLEDLSPIDFHRKENHFFYQCAAQAIERLFLSYPRTLGGDEETVPSIYIDDIRDLYRCDGETQITTRHVGSSEVELTRALSRADLVQGLVSGLWQIHTDEALCLELYRQAQARRLLSSSLFFRLQIEAERWGGRFTAYDGRLQDRSVQERLQQQFDKDHVYSARQFNSYGLCPFQFFCRSVLQLDPRDEALLDLQMPDRRRLTYDILYAFLTRHARARLTKEALETYRNELNEIAQAMFAHYEDTTMPLNAQIWALEKMDMQESLRTILDAEVAYQEKVAAQGVQPYWLELGFGVKDPASCHSDSKTEPLQLQQGADAIKLRGRIDRVDRSDDGKLIAYYYKTSASYSVQDMRDGIDLQIPIYILALRRLFSETPEAIVGGAYYALREGSRNKGLYREDHAHYAGVSPRLESSVSLEEWEAVLKECEAHVWRYVAGMRRGDFRVQPKTTAHCPRCDYRTVCRYDKHRIRGKTEE